MESKTEGAKSGKRGIGRMMFPDRAIVERVKKEYPKGTRVRLLHMADPYREMKPGMTGTVTGVDDAATVHVLWD